MMMEYTYETKHLTVEPHGIRDVMDLEHHIHYLETEAYASILKAFIAQSDLVTWGKEELMTNLRKELNVTDIEHGEILAKINSDELIKQIREQRKVASHANDFIKASAPACATFYARKKMSHSKASLVSLSIPSSIPPKVDDVSLTAEFAHGNAKQSMEIFNYKVQLPPDGGDYKAQLPPIRGGRVLKANHQLQRDVHRSDCVKLNRRPDLIHIRATASVIHDVEEMLFSRDKPEPVAFERAKMTLREQEIAITEALGKVTDMLQRGDAPSQVQHYDVSKNSSPGGQEMMIHANYRRLIRNGRLNALGGSL